MSQRLLPRRTVILNAQSLVSGGRYRSAGPAQKMAAVPAGRSRGGRGRRTCVVWKSLSTKRCFALAKMRDMCFSHTHTTTHTTQKTGNKHVFYKDQFGKLHKPRTKIVEQTPTQHGLLALSHGSLFRLVETNFRRRS
eukprot:2090359-Amphidinium_carterae.1